VPGGWFLDCDHLDEVGGNALHIELIAQAGFKTVVELLGDDDHTPILKAQA
jgi:hypothetical protein